MEEQLVQGTVERDVDHFGEAVGELPLCADVNEPDVEMLAGASNTPVAQACIEGS